jgi:DNA polymerase I
MRVDQLPFREVWAVDFEFSAPPGDRPSPICMVARELHSRREIRLFGAELTSLKRAPFGTDALLVAYYSSAEIGCFLTLEWPTEIAVLDLFTEFRVMTNGAQTPCGSGLLGAAAYHGVGTIGAAGKESMRALALRGPPFSNEEESSLLDYCATDVDVLAQLLPLMLSGMSDEDLGRALLRGRYMRSAASIEHNGVPLDAVLVNKLLNQWDELKGSLVETLGPEHHGIFKKQSFSEAGWRQWLVSRGIPWPLTDGGHLCLDDDTFKDVGRLYPPVETIRQLRHALSQLRLHDLQVGSDGRNRALLSAFRSRTGRNQPSNSRFIFGPAVWMRSLIRADPGCAVAYVDWEQQEFGIGAYLSGDPNMIAAYEAADPYIKFAELAGAVPMGATKASHPEERERFKVCALAVQYGMGASSLAVKLGVSIMEAQELLRKHRETFRSYWAWSDGALNHALLFRRIHTVFGWNLQVGVDANDRSLRNFPVQANGAEMLRLACILNVDAGIEVCAPVHDALLIHGPVDRVAAIVQTVQELMAEASAAVLGGPRLRTEAKVFRFPERYADQRGADMWRTISTLLGQVAS